MNFEIIYKKQPIYIRNQVIYYAPLNACEGTCCIAINTTITYIQAIITA